MIQGCTSDAGKSVLVAGLCRWLARQKTSVAPFKPQNMALNSAVTVDGGEIGRAQAVQAQACYLEPHSDFNPILLKPSSDTGAQVIVHGKAVSSMQATKYHDYKKVAMQAVLNSHKRLDKQYSRIIVEGAGSPAEINLRANDIANMGFAEAIDCPVVIIADIDRGGVFAHLVGTLELLSETEQARVVGFIINRFRGDIALLEPGLEWLTHRTEKPVLGVIPYLSDFFLDAEDAIANSQVFEPSQDTLKVVVPVLPRISNHTDFDALRMHPKVDLEFVSIEQPPPAADLIILPGSKNVLGDLNALREAGWAKAIDKHLRYGGRVMGICGGYQMLGQTLSDPDCVETRLGQVKGFSLLPINTVLEPEKQLKRVSGRLVLAGHNSGTTTKPAELSGYEIHCGVSDKTKPCEAVAQLEDNRLEGAVNKDNSVLGTYLHGLFDHPDACNTLLCWAGLRSDHAPDLNGIREHQLNRLADCLDKHLDAEFLSILSDLPEDSKRSA